MPRFIHALPNLLTACVAAVLLWANLQSTVFETKAAGDFVSYGWPLRTWWFWIFHGGRYHPYEEPLVFAAIGVNALVAGVILWSVRYLAKRLLRRVASQSCLLGAAGRSTDADFS